MPIPVKYLDSYKRLQSTITNEDLFLIVNGTDTYNITGADLINYIKDHPEITKKWGDTRIFQLTGDASGSVSIDGRSDIALEVIISDDSHLHTESTLPSGTTSAKGIVKLEDSNLSSSVTTAATPNSVKIAYDKAVSVDGRAILAETQITESINNEINRAQTTENNLQAMLDTNKPIWDDKYTKNEVDNKFSSFETAIDWKETVDTYADLTTKYPSPEDGWTVNVKDTDYTYRWSGSEWIAISANAIPKATQAVDGLLSKEDKTLYDDANSKKHTHSNKSIIDTITQTLTDKWNEVTNKVDKVDGKGLSANDYTTTEKNKLSGIASGAEVNVQSDWNVTDTASDAYIKNKPSSLPASDVYDWAKAATKPSYTPTEVGVIGTTPTSGQVPVFEGMTGKMKSSGYTIGASVPSDAKFTDTIYTHLSTDGNKHIPANGTTNDGKYLKASGTAGTYAWGSITSDDINKALGYTPGSGSSTIALGETSETAYRGDRGKTAYDHSQAAHAPTNAERNIIIGIQKNGGDLVVDSTSRKVNITVPAKTSELTNDSGYKTTDNNTTYSLSKSGSNIILTGSDGSTASVTPSFSALTSNEVVTALGYTPYRVVSAASEPSGLSVGDEWQQEY